MSLATWFQDSSQLQTSWDSAWAEGRSTNYLNTNSLVYRRQHYPFIVLPPKNTEHSWVWCKYEICMIQQQDMLFRSFGNCVYSRTLINPPLIKYACAYTIKTHAIYQYTKALFVVKWENCIQEKEAELESLAFSLLIHYLNSLWCFSTQYVLTNLYVQKYNVSMQTGEICYRRHQIQRSNNYWHARNTKMHSTLFFHLQKNWFIIEWLSSVRQRRYGI